MGPPELVREPISEVMPRAKIPVATNNPNDDDPTVRDEDGYRGGGRHGGGRLVPIR